MKKRRFEALEPVYFLGANRNLRKPESMTDEECRSLWVYADGEQCISCWKMSVRARLKALFHGRIWLSVLGGRTQPPVWLICEKDVLTVEKVETEGAKQ